MNNIQYQNIHACSSHDTRDQMGRQKNRKVNRQVNRLIERQVDGQKKDRCLDEERKGEEAHRQSKSGQWTWRKVEYYENRSNQLFASFHVYLPVNDQNRAHLPIINKFKQPKDFISNFTAHFAADPVELPVSCLEFVLILAEKTRVCF